MPLATNTDHGSYISLRISNERKKMKEKKNKMSQKDW